MKVNSSEQQGVHIYEVSGNLRAHTACYSFLEVVRNSITEGAAKVIVDLKGVEKLDSAGVGILASIVSSADNAGAELRFSGLSERTEKPIIIVGLMRVMTVSPTVEDALQQMKAD
jgi:anti-sigma B factor antagonist